MNLIESLEKNKKIFIIILIITSISCGVFFLTRIAQKEIQDIQKEPYPLASVSLISKLEPNEKLKIDSIGDIQVSFDDVDFEKAIPKNMRIYKYTKSAGLSETTLNDLIARLDIKNPIRRDDPILGKTVMGENDSALLIAYIEKGQIFITLKTSDTSSLRFEKNTDIKDFKSIAEKYIQSISDNFKVYQFYQSIYYRSQNLHSVPTLTAEMANILELSYELKLDGYELIDKNQSLIPNIARVWIIPNKEIAKVYIETSGNVGDSIGSFPLKGQQEIIEDIKQKKILMFNMDIKTNENINSVQIYDLKPAYLTIKDNYAIPVFIATANVITNLRTNMAFIVIEAVKNEK